MAWWSMSKGGIVVDSDEPGHVPYGELPDWEIERIAKLIQEGYIEGELRDYGRCAGCGDVWEDEDMDAAGRCIDCQGDSRDEQDEQDEPVEVACL